MIVRLFLLFAAFVALLWQKLGVWKWAVAAAVSALVVWKGGSWFVGLSNWAKVFALAAVGVVIVAIRGAIG